jgi:hypothetical protein
LGTWGDFKGNREQRLNSMSIPTFRRVLTTARSKNAAAIRFEVLEDGKRRAAENAGRRDAWHFSVPP